MPIATTPGATDLCLCGHAGAAHDATSQVCRFQLDGKGQPAGRTVACGCQGFGVPGTLGSRPPLTNAPALSGNDNY